MSDAKAARAPKRPLDHDPEAVVWARKAKGWKQAELAAAIEVSPSHMSEIESGTRNAPPWLLNRIAAVLNCPVSLLERKREEGEAA